MKRDHLKKDNIVPVDYTGRICQSYNNEKMAKCVDEIKEMVKKYNIKVDFDYG